ncbi:MAG TPA: hypothetical protein VJN21_00060 [Candidatus Acidoferrales bacterium]|nr:hypothetical protein [Candidatus Acidoferrales bacterium]
MAWEKMTGRATSAQPHGSTQSSVATVASPSTAESDSADGRRETRRSKRVYIAMAVRVAANRGRDSFEEDTATETVNAHGCMIRLSAAVKREDKVSLTNLRSEETIECRVASIGQTVGGRRQVGLEFSTPGGTFWHIAFPPEDWTPPDRDIPEPARPSSGAPKRI